MNEEQLKEAIRFEINMSKLHSKRAHELYAMLVLRKKRRADSEAKKITDAILEKFCG